MNSNKNLLQVTKKIPKSRLSRIGHLSSLVGQVASNMLIDGGKQWVKGRKTTTQELLLVPKNIEKLTDHLARMRGAAMKVGQLLSMDAGDLLPEELTNILSKLRNEAKAVPVSELQIILNNAWGEDWISQFTHFSFYPIAAASIGQVHEVEHIDGRHLALKIQYPGIRKSIDSDVDNLASILKLSGLIPKSVAFDVILDGAKQQLHDEADYLKEASYLQRYKRYLTDDDRFMVPEVHMDLTDENVLAMEFLDGVAIESLMNEPQALRNSVMSSLFDLLFQEMFVFRLVQTDPNFANYLFSIEHQKIVLLDFGATREYSQTIAYGYKHLFKGAMQSNLQMMEQAATEIGFFSEDILPQQKQLVLNLFSQASEPLQEDKTFDFANSDLAKRIKEQGVKLSFEQDYWHTPPVDAIFFHRKLGGLYLLASRLRAEVNVHQIFKQYL